MAPSVPAASVIKWHASVEYQNGCSIPDWEENFQFLQFAQLPNRWRFSAPANRHPSKYSQQHAIAKQQAIKIQSDHL
jgi:hypothetical protein